MRAKNGSRSIFRQKIGEIKWETELEKRHSDRLLDTLRKALHERDWITKEQFEKLFNREWKWIKDKFSIKGSRGHNWGAYINWWKGGVRRYSKSGFPKTKWLMEMEKRIREMDKRETEKREKRNKELSKRNEERYLENEREKSKNGGYKWEEDIGIIGHGRERYDDDDEDEYNEYIRTRFRY